MEQKLEDALKALILLPYARYSEQTDLMIGAVGLEMNAIFSRLYQMQMEYSHAEEFLETGKIKDVQETMEEYREFFVLMKKRLEDSRKNLLECTDQDQAVRQAVGEFLQLFSEILSWLEQNTALTGSDQEKKEQVFLYQHKLETALSMSRAYISLHLGDTSYFMD